jgi:glycosyltransferase involved in cell wall biosynthesis
MSSPASSASSTLAASGRDSPTKVLVVGQTPPPFHGQAIMIEYLVQGNFKNLEIEHVRMDFSSNIEEIGKFSWRKMGALFRTILKVYHAGVFHNIDYLYYPPASPNKIPMLRDVVFLICCRWLFKGTIFHFHAAGISTLYAGLSPLLRALYRLAYFKPDLSIITSGFNPRDDHFFQSLRSVEIPNGIQDQGRPRCTRNNSCPRILYVSALFRSKGILDLLAAACLLTRRGYEFQIDVVGEFESTEFHHECSLFLVENALQHKVFFHGVKTGEQKWEYFDTADIFCFPSYYEAESFPLVLLEAMQFGLPSVGARWRGIQSIIEDGNTGFLVTPRSPDELADKLALLLADEDLRKKMGLRARERYALKHDLKNWFDQMESAITALTTDAGKS